jgi:RNA recognition motif-containing protein
MTTTLRISNLPSKMSIDGLRKWFEKFGEVEHVGVEHVAVSFNESRRFGIVRFENEIDCARAIKGVKKDQHHKIQVSFARKFQWERVVELYRNAKKNQAGGDIISSIIQETQLRRKNVIRLLLKGLERDEIQTFGQEKISIPLEAFTSNDYDEVDMSNIQRDIRRSYFRKLRNTTTISTTRQQVKGTQIANQDKQQQQQTPKRKRKRKRSRGQTRRKRGNQIKSPSPCVSSFTTTKTTTTTTISTAPIVSTKNTTSPIKFVKSLSANDTLNERYQKALKNGEVIVLD